MTKREFLDTVFALAPNEANAIMDAFDEYVDSNEPPAQPAQPERIKGHWIEKPHVHGVAYCSLCDYELHTNDTNFCPNCGAEMEETE